MKENILLAALLCAASGMPAAAQDAPSTRGGWADFGVQNRDTTIFMDNRELTTNNRSRLFFADFRKSFDISMQMRFNTLTEMGIAK